jgi:hypothetical protein
LNPATNFFSLLSDFLLKRNKILKSFFDVPILSFFLSQPEIYGNAKCMATTKIKVLKPLKIFRVGRHNAATREAEQCLDKF